MTDLPGRLDLDSLVDLVHRDTLDQGVGDADLERIVTRHAPLLSAAQRDDITSRVEARVSGLGAIDVLLADPDVSVWLRPHGIEIEFQNHGYVEEMRTEPLLVPRSADPLILASASTLPDKHACLTKRGDSRKIAAIDMESYGVAASDRRRVNGDQGNL